MVDAMGRMLLTQHIEYVSRLTLIVFAAGVVVISATLAWTCGLIVGVHQITGLYVLYGIEPATAFAITYASFPLVRATLGIVLVAANIGPWAKCFNAAVWLLLLVYVSLVNALCLASDISNGLAVAGTVLVVEILSGCLPALVYVVCQAPSTPTRGGSPALEPLHNSTAPFAPLVQVLTPQDAQVAQPEPTPTFPDVQAFVRHVQACGSSQFPGVRLNADGSLQGGQRAYARSLGISLGACNELLHQEYEAGRLLMTCSSRGTRIALPHSAAY